MTNHKVIYGMPIFATFAKLVPLVIFNILSVLSTVAAAISDIDARARIDNSVNIKATNTSKNNKANPDYPRFPKDCHASSTITHLCDQLAIKAMAGHYLVRFNFVETTALTNNYELKPVKQSGGDELISIIEDQPNVIALQHLLEVGGGHVVKHWRQDWQYEPTTIWQYEGNDTWQRYRLTQAQRQGKWLQTVWQVDDSPRYASLGYWVHDGNAHKWYGEATNRPLPRREFTTRNDYDILYGENSHDIGPQGWTHLQHNLKQKDGSDSSQSAVYLVKEVGINTYRYNPKRNFADAKAYWQRTAPFWQAARVYWQNSFATSSRIVTAHDVNDFGMYQTLFMAAQEYANAKIKPTPSQLLKQVAALYDPFIKKTPLIGGTAALPVLPTPPKSALP